MINKIGLLVFVLVVTGCSASNGLNPPTPTRVETNEPTRAPINSVVTMQPTPTVSVETTPIQSPFPAGSKPPTTPTVSNGWKTLVSARLQVALDYPPDWSVHEDAAGVTFASTQGANVALVRVETGNTPPENFLNESDLPNYRCVSSVNGHGLGVRTCIDTIGFTYVANFVIKSPGGPEQLLTLTTRSRGLLETFNAMVASARAVP
jgi:hypothetical protein